MRVSLKTQDGGTGYAKEESMTARNRAGTSTRAWVVTGLALILSSGCSIKTMALNSLADTLAELGTVYASDEDPELVRDAFPFSLMTAETLLQSSPRHPGLLLSACSGFTGYANLFLQTDADLVEWEDYEAAVELRDRALRMYVRARDYCLRRLELDYPGVTDRLMLEPEAAPAVMTVEDVPVLYWLGASWGSAISLGLDKPELAIDLPAVRALMDRALELDEDYSRGAIHEVLIVLEAVPEVMGGSPERAREHFARAVELSDGNSAGPYVTLAESVSVATQSRAEFERLLDEALQVDPDAEKSVRLLNLIAQKRARHLLAHIDELFVDPAEPQETLR